MFDKCPGQDKRLAQAENITCSNCGYVAEIFSDEIKVRCPQCKNLICKERLPSCVDWCKAARECIGDRAYAKYSEDKHLTVIERLLKELEVHFGSDNKRIEHAKKVLSFAQELLKAEVADWNIVIPASILHDVGIKAAEEKYGSCSGAYQEKEGPEIARRILLKLGMKKDDIDQICQIIAHHHSPGLINTANFKVLYDADWLVNLKDEFNVNERDKLRGVIEKIFLTKRGKELAKRIYLKQE